MYFELGLLSVVITTAYLAPLLLRRLPRGRRAYGWMLLATAGAALAAYVGHRSGGPAELDLLGAIAIGAAVFLVLVPPILRDLTRRALMRDRPRLALALINLREHLQPGMGADGERAAMESFLAVREGRVEEAVAALREARRQITAVAAPESERALARRQIDERIITLYLSGRRYREAVGYFDSELGAATPMTAPLLVELMRACCEIGDRAGAARLFQRLEAAPAASDPSWAPLLGRARLVFLAFHGRTAAVAALLTRDGALADLPRSSRAYWVGVAALHAGEVAEARRLLTEAVKRSRHDRRAHEVAIEVLASVDRPGVAGPHAVSDEVAALADRLAAAPPGPAVLRLPELGSVPLRRMPVTAALVVANLAVATLLVALLGSAGDQGVLVRAGANVQSAVAAGEWWRLPASMFLHVGWVHLLVNMYALWTLGRLVEQLYGSLRFFALYGGAGIAGAAASFALGGAHVSAGASGAIFGVLGAALAELAVHRKAYPARWRRALFRALAFMTAAQVMVGFLYAQLDQSAHLGGLLVGAGLGLALAGVRRRGVWARVGRGAAAVLSAAMLIAYVWAAWAVATTSWADTLDRVGDQPRVFGEVVVRAPASWQPVEGERVLDPAPYTLFGFGRAALDGSVDDALAALDRARPSDLTFSAAAAPLLALPPPWQSREQRGVGQQLGGDQLFRWIVFGRDVGPGETLPAGRWVGSLLMPEVLAEDAAARLTAMILSVRQADTTTLAPP